MENAAPEFRAADTPTTRAKAETNTPHALISPATPIKISCVQFIDFKAILEIQLPGIAVYYC